MSHRRPWFAPAALAVALALLAAACADGAPGPDEQQDDPDAAADPVDDQATDASTDAATELILAIGGEPDDGYDPTLGWGRYGSPLFQSTLLRRDADLALVGDLATDWSVSDDGLTWTVSIRDDVVFSDGEPLTAEDVAYTYRTAATSGGLVDLADLDDAVALNDTTVELTLSQPRSTFLAQLTTVGIVPEHAHDESYARNPVGSGPFVLERWDEGQQLIVTRNDGFYGEQPAFERLVFLFTDEDGSLAAARAGEIQVAGLPQTLATDELDGMRLVAVPSVDNRGVMLPFQPAGETTEAGLPIGNDVTSDVAIRQALNLAVDRDVLAESILEGYGTPAHGPVDGLPWFEPNTVIDDGDLAAAAEVLAEAGWSDENGEGVLTKDGIEARFSLVYPASDSVRQALALSFRDMVAELGIEVEVDGGSWDEIAERMHADAVVFGWGSHDQTEMYNLYHSSRAGVDFFNTGFFIDEQVDTYLDLAMGATDPAEAEVWWRAAQLDEDGHGLAAQSLAGWAWLVNLDHTYLVDDCLDLGQLQVEPHGHGWPITAGITGWRWTC